VTRTLTENKLVKEGSHDVTPPSTNQKSIKYLAAHKKDEGASKFQLETPNPEPS